MKKGSSCRRSRIGAVPFFAILGGIAFAGRAAALDPPVAPAVSNGSYAVTYPDCSGCAADWLEERAGDTGAWHYAGTGEVRYSGKPDGRYEYRVGYVYLNFDYSSFTLYGPVGSVVVSADLPEPEALDRQLAYRYESRRGDVDGDGRTDLYIERTQGGRSGDGTIAAVILRQAADGTFEGIAPSSSQRAAAASWPEGGVEIRATDINVDGLADLLLERVGAAVGKSAISNQIVYAPGTAPGLDVRALDADFTRFGADIEKYLRDPDYFRTHAPTGYLQQTFRITICGGYAGGYDLQSGLPYDCVPAPILVVSPYPDYSVFAPDAVAVWAAETAADGRRITPGEAQMRVGKITEGIAGAAVGGWSELGAARSLDTEARRGIELFTALLRISEAAAAESEPSGRAARSRDRVYVTGRRIIGFLPFHTALEYAGSTISAHDTEPSSFVDGRLISEVDWGPDRPVFMLTLGTVSSSLAPTAYWARLRAADAGYSDRLPYDTLPSIGSGGYNSNGYTHGIVLATHGVSSVDLNGFVGGERPVPSGEYF